MCPTIKQISDSRSQVLTAGAGPVTMEEIGGVILELEASHIFMAFKDRVRCLPTYVFFTQLCPHDPFRGPRNHKH